MDGAADITLDERFGGFIQNRGFPCARAKSALAKNQIEVFTARDIRSA